MTGLLMASESLSRSRIHMAANCGNLKNSVAEGFLINQVMIVLRWKSAKNFVKKGNKMTISGVIVTNGRLVIVQVPFINLAFERATK